VNFDCLPTTTSWIESISRSLLVGIDLTISSHFPEESVAAPKVTAGSNVLGFLGGIALGFLPVLMVVLMFISPLFTDVYFDSSISGILSLSGILVVGGSIFAIVKRKYGLGIGVLVGFFGGLGLVIVLAFALMAYAINSVW
jgi:hypothetical protein